jgi:two-component system chemotaxis response regulator CheB
VPPAPARSQAADAARVMICDDSAVIRRAIGNILEADPGIRVVARVNNGQEALDSIARQPVDVVVLDIEMPVMDGLTALPLLLKAAPGVSIIMASTLTTRGADVALRAIRLGAADTIPKPSAADIQDGRFAAELLARVKGLARLNRSSRLAPGPAGGTAGLARRDAPASAHGFALAPPPRQVPLLLAIGSSTGGPNALFTLVKSLGPSIRVPVVLTQHMPPTFTAILAEHIDRLGVLPCGEARQGAPLRPGHITLAPGDRHLLVKRASPGLAAELSDAPAENFCRPAVDPMLRSAAAAVDGRVLVVMLTGMGQDGLLGTRGIVEAGGAAVAQDEASSVVWGMPGAVAKAGLAHAVLPLAQIGARVLKLLDPHAAGGR